MPLAEHGLHCRIDPRTSHGLVIAALERAKVTDAHIEDGAREVAFEFIRWLASKVLVADISRQGIVSTLFKVLVAVEGISSIFKVLVAS